jgi:hypothetical protein
MKLWRHSLNGNKAQERKHNMINVQFDKQKTFNLPEGTFNAVISKVASRKKLDGDDGQECVRILFDVEVPSLSNLDCMAGINLPLQLHQGSELYNFLKRLFGSEFVKEMSGKNFNLETLVGTECVVELVHCHTSKYEKPLVKVAAVYKRNPVKNDHTEKEKGGAGKD